MINNIKPSSTGLHLWTTHLNSTISSADDRKEQESGS
ncbi:hypothetical protein TGAMA5MH_00225 [Trichoderma gamsii]|uniref:Uncharacterized protein n=1 Tax=Trichoderma gamsii TaxID=398673 RepID=A0A2K0TTF6_9HYPO|nr:hypothetical protein TGAMA5MH_00225 [Trichoderma gamsii]